MNNIAKTNEVPYHFLPSVFSIAPSNSQTNIFSFSPAPSYSITDFNYPKFSYGFQHYYHQSLGKMTVTDEFIGKKKVYLVLNPFEKNVDDYDEDIDNYSRIFFASNTSFNRSFFKLWEILFSFDLINLSNSSFSSLHLGENTGSFINSTLSFRNKYSNNKINSNDHYSFIADSNTSIDSLGKNDSRIVPTSFSNFKKNSADFITSDGTSQWKNIITQESEVYKFIIQQIYFVINCQKKNGNAVFKFYESFTLITPKLFVILRHFYNDVFIFKPLMSRIYNTEKFLICLNFKFSSNNEDVMKFNDFYNSVNNSSFNLVDIFPEYYISPEFKNLLIKMNTEIADKQYISINKIVDFIKKQNYRGEVYQTARNLQIEASKYWIDRFFPDNLEFTEKRTFIFNLISEIINKNK